MHCGTPSLIKVNTSPVAKPAIDDVVTYMSIMKFTHNCVKRHYWYIIFVK